MPLYIDLHRGLNGVSCSELEHAHYLDEQVQDKHGVKYHKFWLNEDTGTLIGRNFQFEEAEPQNLKGFSEPVKTFVVHGY